MLSWGHGDRGGYAKLFIDMIFVIMLNEVCKEVA